MPIVNANSVDPVQTPRSVASYLGLHCLPVPLLWDARKKWVKILGGMANSSDPYLGLRFAYAIL